MRNTDKSIETWGNRGDKYPPVSLILKEKGGGIVLKVEYGDIFLTRGDSASFSVRVTQPDGAEYRLEPGDAMVFTVKRSTDDARHVFSIDPEDTSGLDYGEYQYDVQLTRARGNRVSTVLGPHRFCVMEEVSF